MVKNCTLARKKIDFFNGLSNNFDIFKFFKNRFLHDDKWLKALILVYTVLYLLIYVHSDVHCTYAEHRSYMQKCFVARKKGS